MSGRDGWLQSAGRMTDETQAEIRNRASIVPRLLLGEIKFRQIFVQKYYFGQKSGGI